MLSIHTLLHPTDFSDQSQYAFWLACAMARDYGARLVVLHVAPLAAPLYYGEGMIPPDPEELCAAAQEKLNRLEAPNAGVRLERRLERGSAALEILRVGQEIQTDLIVMGTHGRTGLGRLLMGSVAEQVVRKAPCPVLTVKTPFPETTPAMQRTEAEAVLA